MLRAKNGVGGWVLVVAGALGLVVPTPASAQQLDWAAAQGGSEDEFTTGSAVGADGTSVTVGWFQGTADFDPGPGTQLLTLSGPQAGYIAALDVDGDFAWAFAIDGPQANTAHDVAIDDAGNVYAVGEFRNTVDFDPGSGQHLLTAAGTSAFILKLGPDGSFVWVRQVNVPTARAVAVDAGGDLLVAGWFWSPADLDPGAGVFSVTPQSTFPKHDVWVIRLDPAGDFLWGAQIGGTDATPEAVAIDADGNAVVAGFYSGTIDADPGAGSTPLTAGGFEDLFVISLDPSGDLGWARSLGVTSRATGTATDADGNVVVGGVFSNTADFGNGYLLTSNGAQDPFVWKLDPAGAPLWARHIGSVATDFAGGVATDAAGAAYLTGWFRNTVDFDPGAGSFPLTSAGSHDPFAWKLTGDGELAWAVNLGGTSQDEGVDIGVDPAGGVYVAGIFRGTADLDPGPDSWPVTSAGRADQFVVRLVQPDPPCNPVQRATLTPSNGRAFLQIGTRTAIDGDTALAGSLTHPDDPGSKLRSAWVFQRNEGGLGNWGQVAELLAGDQLEGDDYGFSVALSGDIALVGAPRADGVASETGAAYLFERDAGGTDAWGEVVRLVAADGNTGARFGWGLAVDASTAAVGAHGTTTGAPFAGAVYIFERDAGGPGNWGQTARIVSPDPGTADDFGFDVDLDGDILIVGAEGNDDFGERSGSAYVFARDAGGPGNWGLVEKLLPDDGAAGDNFGLSVGVDDGVAVVSAPNHAGSDTNSGAAYIFERHVGGTDNWGQTLELVGSGVGSGEAFGRYVAIDGDGIAVGAVAHPLPSREGAVYLFRRDQGGPSAWGEAAVFVHAGAQPGDELGWSAAISGGSVVGGAVGADLFGFQSGAAYVFECPDGNGPPDADGDGFDETVDCDDGDATVYPGAEELCNGVDDNCDGAVDEGLDADADGTADCFDGCPDDPAKLAPGVCGCGVSDSDGDGDGTPDCLDLCPADPAKTNPQVCGCGVAETDTDGDGALDCVEECPADPAKTEAGVCGCGVPDVDTDGDGALDCVDECPADPFKEAPGLCGCGVADTDGDGDGTVDCLDACPADADKTDPGICGCGQPDTDTDADGTPDCVDACPDDAGKTDPGVCGCGVADNDADGDGAADCVDLCPIDPAKVDPGVCGCGVADIDTDGDGVADCDDTCVDSDLLPTVIVDGCDSGVANLALDDGCTLGDGVLACAEEAKNHGQFVACVAHLTRDLKREGAISGAEKGAIDACAAQADLP